MTVTVSTGPNTQLNVIHTQKDLAQLQYKGWQISKQNTVEFEGKTYTVIVLTRDPSVYAQCDAGCTTLGKSLKYIAAAPFVFAASLVASASCCAAATVAMAGLEYTYDEGLKSYTTMIGVNRQTIYLSNRPAVESMGREKWDENREDFSKKSEAACEKSLDVFNWNCQLLDYTQACIYQAPPKEEQTIKIEGVLTPSVAQISPQKATPANTLKVPLLEEFKDEEK